MSYIALQGMEFFAYHGFYEEEQKIGNRYVVDVQVDWDIRSAGSTDDLVQTINYEQIYASVSRVMNQQHKLLESVAESILCDIRSYFSQGKVTIKVAKFNPPIGGICHQAVICLTDPE